MPEYDKEERSFYRKACALLRFHNMGDPGTMTDEQFCMAWNDLQWVLKVKAGEIEF